MGLVARREIASILAERGLEWVRCVTSHAIASNELPPAEVACSLARPVSRTLLLERCTVSCTYMSNPCLPAGCKCLCLRRCSARRLSYGQCLTIPRSRHEAANAGGRGAVWSGPSRNQPRACDSWPQSCRPSPLAAGGD